MATQRNTSQHLASARRLLDEVASDTSAESDAQAKATAAVAHSILVLAEQVAAARVVMATDAVDGVVAQNYLAERRSRARHQAPRPARPAPPIRM
jgi:hypothetical protein